MIWNSFLTLVSLPLAIDAFEQIEVGSDGSDIALEPVSNLSVDLTLADIELRNHSQLPKGVRVEQGLLS